MTSTHQNHGHHHHLPGGDYTKADLQTAARSGLEGHRIDASKILRMDDDAIIILDPINMPVIRRRWPRASATGSAATAP